MGTLRTTVGVENVSQRGEIRELRLDVVRKQLVDAGPILAVAVTHS